MRRKTASHSHLPRYLIVCSLLLLPWLSFSAGMGRASENQDVFLPLAMNRFATLPGKIQGTIVDSRNNQLITGATVCAGANYCYVTNEDGAYELSSLPTGLYNVQASRSGYIRLMQPANIGNGKTTTLNFALSPNLAGGEFRIVLTWGAEPQDLDSHLWTPYPEYPHLFLEHPGNCDVFPEACLDIDDRDGYGPETISIIHSANEGTYAYAILDYYYGDEYNIIDALARVQVYNANGLIDQYDVPTTGEGDLWYVFNLDAATGTISEVNCITWYPGDNPPQCNPPPGVRANTYVKIP
jgi:uncharacterized protein YfaP (DUF2135 family)